jgi:hypothetical protein
VPCVCGAVEDVEAGMRKRIYVYQISLTEQAQDIVNRLIDRGLYGTTCAEVARRLLETSLIQFTRHRLIAPSAPTEEA